MGSTHPLHTCASFTRVHSCTKMRWEKGRGRIFSLKGWGPLHNAASWEGEGRAGSGIGCDSFAGMVVGDEPSEDGF